MAILHHRDVLSAKHTTAVIMDNNNRVHFVPIKHTIIDHFLAEVGKTLYVFSLKGAKIYVTGDMASKHARIILYDVTHYKAVDPAAVQELGLLLTENGLPKVNRALLRIFQVFAQREAAAKSKDARASANEAVAGGTEFEPHDIQWLVDSLANEPTRWGREAEPLLEYVRGLGARSICMPVKRIADYIHEDLLATDPSFLGELSSRVARTETQNGVMTNTPKKSTLSWAKWLMVAVMGATVVGLIFAGMDAGWFDSVTGLVPDLDLSGLGNVMQPGGLSLGGSSPAAVQDCSAEGLQARYPSPWDLKVAVDTGAETCELPKALADSIKNIEPPTVEPVGEPVP